ncbi:MAG: 3-deoxy-7-phosphoheptulonate synthase [Collinsella sp.]|nr:3-deoxy-7-phosphoheptulonate synthase [Collinsella sp.]
MIAILKKDAPLDAVDQLIDWIERKGLQTHVSHGESETIIGLVGDTTKIDPFLLESMDIVKRVQRVSEPFKKANRSFHPADSVVDCGHGVKIGGGHFQVIAGPCSVEGGNLLRIARRCKAAGATMLRGGAYKPRTSPYAYQGMGSEGLDLLIEASRELDMPIVTEIMDPRDVELFLDKGIDVMQIGARNAQNFTLLKEVGKTSTPILLKRGMSGTLDELLMAAEYIMSEGNDNVILCERGIRTFETRTRNTFDLNAVPALHYLSHLPVVADPSHATGYTRYVEPMALAAVAAGADGLEIEVHDDPARAWSDGAQALTPEMFERTMERIRAIRAALVDDEGACAHVCD